MRRSFIGGVRGMKKILFCGGSHMNNANRSIKEKFQVMNIDFYISAGPKNRIWSQNGGVYKVQETTISGNGKNPNLAIDLSKYDFIIFVGQWIQPFRYFNEFQKLSKCLLKEILHENCFINMPENIYNEPLYLFNKLAPKRTILIPDPLPNDPYIDNIPYDYIKMFYSELDGFCQRNSIILHMPTTSLLEEGKLRTKKKYIKSYPEKVNHCIKEYWDILFNEFNYF